MSEEELKRMEDFVNATLKPDKSNEYRLGYEDALRRCYYLVDNLQQENKQLKEEIEEYKRIEQEDLKAFNNYDSILTELEEWLKNEKDYYFENYYYSDFNAYGSKLNDVLDKIQKLKEKYK